MKDIMEIPPIEPGDKVLFMAPDISKKSLPIIKEELTNFLKSDSKIACIDYDFKIAIFRGSNEKNDN